MKHEIKQELLSHINQEGFHYFFVHYTDCKEYESEKLLELRDNYLRAVKDIEKFLDKP